MDKQERGVLLAEAEEVSTRIEQIRRQLASWGEIYENLGQKLMSEPERVVFANAPQGYGEHGLDLMNVPSIDWTSIPDKLGPAAMIQDLRRQTKQLADIQMRLRTAF